MVIARNDKPELPLTEVARRAPSFEGTRRLHGLILLAGKMRSCPLSDGLGRSILDLPVDDQKTILGHWAENIQELKYALGRRELPVRLLMDRDSRMPVSVDPTEHPAWSLERDLREYRGTAGVLFDACQQYDPDDYILVANANQVLLEPLSDLLGDLSASPADVSLIGQGEGTPVGLFLIRCGTLKNVPGRGYFDLKEMALPAIAREHVVDVVEREQPAAFPVRTGPEYLAALRGFHKARRGLSVQPDPFEEDWSSAFSIVEEGASVDPRSVLFDSVVLAGARVESQAVVVRSLVGTRASVPTGSTVIDRVLP